MTTDLSAILVGVKRFFWRYHLTIFIVVAASGIAIAIFSLIGVIAQSSDTSGFTATESTTFDKATIEKVKKLNDQPSYDFSLPTNQRSNPFME